MHEGLTLHCCWLVDAWQEIRSDVIAAWRELLGLPVVLWHSGQLGCTPPGVTLRHIDTLPARECEALRYEIANRSHAAAADLLRYMALEAYGGIYFDLDISPSKYAKERTLKHLAAGSGPRLGREARFLEIRLICVPRPNDPDIVRLKALSLQGAEAFRASGGYAKHGYDVRELLERSGPLFAARVLFGTPVENCFSFSEQMTRHLSRWSFGSMYKAYPGLPKFGCGERRPEIEAAAGYQTSSLQRTPLGRGN